MALDSKDIREYQAKHSEYLNQLRLLDSEDFTTKRQLVIRLIEVTRPLVENGYVKGLKLQDLAIYINNRLEEYDIQYPRNQAFYNLFREGETLGGTNIVSTTGRSHTHEFIEDECECGIIKHNNLLYSVHIEVEKEKKQDSETAADKTKSEHKEQFDPYKYLETEYLFRVKKNWLLHWQIKRLSSHLLLIPITQFIRVIRITISTH